MAERSRVGRGLQFAQIEMARGQLFIQGHPEIYAHEQFVFREIHI